jgi:ABC-type transport system substrate-binding protein
MTGITRRQLLGATPVSVLGLAHLARTPLGADAQEATDQTLRLVSWALPATLSPTLEGGPLSMMTLNTFMTPFYEDFDGNIVNGTCNDWSVSEDGLVYTLKVDPAAKFSDGTQVTANDLKFTLDYLTDPDTGAWAPGFITAPIAGYDEAIAGTAEGLSGVTVIDDATLQITLAKPFTAFIKALTINCNGVVQKANVEAGGKTWDDNAVCCGPYKIDSWNKDNGEVNWVLNEHWWGAKPSIAKVNYRYIQDANTQSIMYDNDEVDVVQPSDILAAQMKVGPHAAELIPIPQGGTVFFNFDTTRAPFEDVNVRRAFLKASDMGTIVEAVFKGGARVAYGLTSPNLKGFADPPTFFDAEGAKAALAASTYGSADKLPPISIRVPTNVTEYVRVAEALQQMWKDTLGIDTTISLRAQGEEADDGTSQIFRRSLGALYNDPPVLVSGLGLSSGPIMSSAVKAVNAELDDILTQANSLPIEQEAERVQLSQQAEQMIMDQAYYIPIIWVEYFYATKPWVSGLASNACLSIYSLPEMTISEH